jgi:hypothetical protein
MHSPRREEEEEKRGLLKTLAAARNVVPPFLFVRPFEGEFSPNWEDRSRCSVTIFAIIPLPFLLCFFFTFSMPQSRVDSNKASSCWGSAIRGD